MMQGAIARWSVLVLLAVIAVFLVSSGHASALPVAPSPDALAPSAGVDDVDPSEAADSEGTAPAAPPNVLNNPDCSAIVNNPEFQKTASNNRVLSKEQCAAFNDLLRSYNQTNQATEPNNRGIILLDPVFALNLDKMLKAADAAHFHITVISGYRNPKNNPPGGAGAGSLHHKGLAADLCFPDAPCIKSDPRGSFHTCEQADTSKISRAYLWIYGYMSSSKNGLATLMQVFNKPPSTYPGECDHVRDITGAGGLKPVTSLSSASPLKGGSPFPAGSGSGTGGGTGTGSNAGNGTTNINGQTYTICSTAPLMVVPVGQSCASAVSCSPTPSPFGSFGSLFSLSSSKPSCTLNNGTSGGSNDMMNQMMQMTMMQNMMKSLGGLTGSNSQPSSQPTSGAVASAPTPLPPIPINNTPLTGGTSGGQSTIDALIAALNNQNQNKTNGTSTNMNGTSPVSTGTSNGTGQVQATTTPPTNTSTSSDMTITPPGPSVGGSGSGTSTVTVSAPPSIIFVVGQGAIDGFYLRMLALRNFFWRMFGGAPIGG